MNHPEFLTLVSLFTTGSIGTQTPFKRGDGQGHMFVPSRRNRDYELGLHALESAWFAIASEIPLDQIDFEAPTQIGLDMLSPDHQPTQLQRKQAAKSFMAKFSQETPGLTIEALGRIWENGKLDRPKKTLENAEAQLVRTRWWMDTMVTAAMLEDEDMDRIGIITDWNMYNIWEFPDNEMSRRLISISKVNEIAEVLAQHPQTDCTYTVKSISDPKGIQTFRIKAPERGIRAVESIQDESVSPTITQKNPQSLIDTQPIDTTALDLEEDPTTIQSAGGTIFRAPPSRAAQEQENTMRRYPKGRALNTVRPQLSQITDETSESDAKRILNDAIDLLAMTGSPYRLAEFLDKENTQPWMAPFRTLFPQPVMRVQKTT